ncbi:MAG: rRNA maturation RNase YbeY [Candidatus Omnitrophica bacterium]|nr:rRNA maturation RNase YbeY [Candidatus Omnitrophota bacterium]
MKKVYGKMKGGVKIIIKNLQKKIHLNPKRIKVAVLKLLSLEGRKKSGEITICFFNDRQIREFNLFYRGRDVATDVIAFDNSVHKKEISGDIAVSCETAIRNARIFKTTPLSEIYLYVIHGLLHIIGYNDNNKKNRLIMQKKEKEILREFITRKVT